MQHALAKTLKVQDFQVKAAIALMEAGYAIPFIARHRKALTGGLTLGQLRQMESKWRQGKAFEARKAAILADLADHPAIETLKTAILQAPHLFYLEDLYLPFRPHRQAQIKIAQDNGITALSEALLAAPQQDPEALAQPYLSQQMTTVKAVLSQARYFLIEQWCANPDLMQQLREKVWQEAFILAEATAQSPQKHPFKAEIGINLPVHQLSGEKAWRLFKGRAANRLKLTLQLPDEAAYWAMFNIPTNATWLTETLKQAWQTKIWPKLVTETLARLRELAEASALSAFRHRFRTQLMQQGMKHKVVMGVEVIFRLGVKIVVLDKVGQCIDQTIIYPFIPECAKEEAIAELAKLMMRYHVEAISIGKAKQANDMQLLLEAVVKRYPDLHCPIQLVNANGAVEYAHSAAAEKALPQLEKKWRSTVSIARRLQDPLNEWIHMDPKAIGLAQEVNPNRFAHCMQTVIEDCVSLQAVDPNHASSALLSRVPGLNEKWAEAIVNYRETEGPWKDAQQLKSVLQWDDKTHEQAICFLKIKPTIQKQEKPKGVVKAAPLNTAMADALAQWKAKSS